MVSSLGTSYGKIVRKCLGCDFGEGRADLQHPGLQAVFNIERGVWVGEIREEACNVAAWYLNQDLSGSPDRSSEGAAAANSILLAGQSDRTIRC